MAISATVYHILARLGLTSYLDAVVISGEFGSCKPHPAIFRQGVKRLGATEREAVFVGDDLKVDIEGAATCGMDTILVDRREQHPSYPGVRATGLSEAATILGLTV